MPPTIVQRQKGNATGALSVTATYAPAPTEDNLLVAVVATNFASSPTNAGWTQAVTRLNPTENDRSEIWYKVAGAGESATVTFSFSGPDDHALVIYEISGCETTGVLDQTNSTGRDASATSKAVGSVTTTVADEILIAGVGIRGTVTAPSVDSSYLNVQQEVGGPGGGEITALSAERIVAATGTFNPTFSWTTARIVNGGVHATFKGIAAAAGAVGPLIGTGLAGGRGRLIA